MLGSDNKFHAYWNSGDGTVRENVTIGQINNTDGDWAIVLGSTNYRQNGIWLRHATGYSGTGIDISGYTTGVSSIASGTGGYGLIGKADNGTGVRGESINASYSGVHGYVGTTTNGRGVLGTATGTGGTGVYGDAAAGTGVKGNATSGAGVNGLATTGIGVSAKATGSGGVPLKLEGVAGSTSGGHIYAVPMAGDANNWPSAAAPDGTLAVVVDQFGWPQLWIKTTNAVNGVNGGWRRFQWGRLTLVACILLPGCQSVYVAIGVHPPGLDALIQ